jgi:hypothetical protein
MPTREVRVWRTWRTWFAAAAAGSAMAVAHAALPETQVTGALITDFEFDWGRDGVYCAACNQGAGNARFTFTDNDHNLWVGQIDPDSGAFAPLDGRGVLADTGAAPAEAYKNGPEWVHGPDGSAITYVKYRPGEPTTTRNAGIGIAVQTGGSWSGAMLPGAEQRFVPFGSLDIDDPRPRLVYQSQARNRAYWRYLDDPTSERPLHSENTVCSRRWVPGRPAIVLVSPCQTRVLQPPQVYWHDVSTGEELAITTDASPKLYAFAWRAPEFGNDFALLTVGGRQSLMIFRQPAAGPASGPWTLVKTIRGPADKPYIDSPEPFVHNGKSYIVMSVDASPDYDDKTVPSHIALSGIEPAVESFRLLTDDDSMPRLRVDPEYYITSQGPFIYYNRYRAATGGNPAVPEGVWRVDTGLGPPLP